MPEITDEQIAAWEAQDDYDYQLISRINKLERLCNDLFNHVCAEQIGARVTMAQFVELSDRMDDLGLLEELHG